MKGIGGTLHQNAELHDSTPLLAEAFFLFFFTIFILFDSDVIILS